VNQDFSKNLIRIRLYLINGAFTLDVKSV